jgi:hypothetical protein
LRQSRFFSNNQEERLCELRLPHFYWSLYWGLQVWEKLRKGLVVGLHGKLHPAINQSIYEAGDKTPVYTVAVMNLGILICLDSNHEVTLTPYQ